MKDKSKPDTAKVSVEIRVMNGDGFASDAIAETELSERVVLSAQGNPFDPVLSMVEQITREAANKTTAQVQTFEHLLRAADEAPAVPF